MRLTLVAGVVALFILAMPVSSFSGIKRDSKIRRLDDLGRHLAYDDRRVRWRESVGLNDHRGAGLAMVAGCRDDHDITTSHRFRGASGASNADTSSIQLKASSSLAVLERETCRATRRRTDRERASGTTRRTSRRPRERRRSRILCIRSAGAAIWHSLSPIASTSQRNALRCWDKLATVSLRWRRVRG